MAAAAVPVAATTAATAVIQSVTSGSAATARQLHGLVGRRLVEHHCWHRVERRRRTSESNRAIGNAFYRSQSPDGPESLGIGTVMRARLACGCTVSRSTACGFDERGTGRCLASAAACIDEFQRAEAGQWPVHEEDFDREVWLDVRLA